MIGETMETMSLPQKGVSREEILGKLSAMKSGDSDWEGGRVFSLVYNAGEDVAAIARDAYRVFIAENGLSPFAFPSLLRMETEVVSMVAGLLGGNAETAGAMTSGGSESIFMAMKAARDYAREHKPRIASPEIVIPLSAHPAFNKAAHYLGLKTIITPLRPDLTADPAAIREAAGGNAIFMVGSACSYPHGMIDPIEELAAIARERDIWFHVDACVGGLILPFLTRLGKDIPPFDFRVEGVRSVSADLHKYGYIPKGASVVLYRTGELRKHQFFAYADWPGGVYGTPSLSGSRPGGAIAASWAVMNYLGEEGYLRLAGQISEATSR
ncbi:MAG: aspartate aminotransferase family protein, partial [Smithellaceae bacterium]|nr:aspartate aminotransferase family protein [Smithellaceae bacterium]